MIKGHSVLGLIVVSSTNKKRHPRDVFFYLFIGLRVRTYERRFDYQREAHGGVPVGKADERQCD